MEGARTDFSPKEQLAVIRRGCVDLVTEEELLRKLERCQATGTPLRVKAGFDPTAPDLHLGHTVLLQKLRQFQELGHTVYFLIGDLTGMVGDPSGRTEARKPLTQEEVQENARTYEAQVFKVLDPRRTEVCFNSTWYRGMGILDLLTLTAKQTVARMLERDDFQARFKAGRDITLLEFLYPLLQGYDSVAIRADVEVGGTDQKFNLLMGRTIQRRYGQEEQVILTLPLLEGTDGVRKMSKSYGNTVGINDPPNEMFGKLMSISDALMLRYYELLSDLSLEALQRLRHDLETGDLHPMEAKKRLAEELVARFHGREAASRARREFERVFSAREMPEELPTVEIPWTGERMGLPQILTLAGLTESRSAARRLISQGAVEVDGVRIHDPAATLPAGRLFVVRVGKRRFAKIKSA